MLGGEASKKQTLFLPQGLSNLVRRTGLVNRSLEYETGHKLCPGKGTDWAYCWLLRAGCCRPSWPRSRLKGLGLRDWGDFGERNKQPQGRTMNEVRRFWRWGMEGGGMKGPPENGLRFYCCLVWGDTLQCSRVSSCGAGGREGDVHVVFGVLKGVDLVQEKALYLLYCLSSLVLKNFFKITPASPPLSKS